MSTWAAAKTTPKSAVASPIASAITPHHQSGEPSRSKATRAIP